MDNILVGSAVGIVTFVAGGYTKQGLDRLGGKMGDAAKNQKLRRRQNDLVR